MYVCVFIYLYLFVIFRLLGQKLVTFLTRILNVIFQYCEFLYTFSVMDENSQTTTRTSISNEIL